MTKHLAKNLSKNFSKNLGTNSAPLLRVVGLTKAYPTPQGPLTVLDGVDLRIEAGASLAVTGESGSGKSTLLHLISGLDAPDAGEVFFDGAPLGRLSETQRAAFRRENVGVVFQQFNLVPSLTVADNLAFQARLCGRFDPVWSGEAVRRLGLERLLDRYPEQLSGGQQQRVAIGRALCARPRLLVADEPTGNLDEAAAAEFMRLALEMTAGAGCAFVMATHSARLSSLLGRRLRLSQGRLQDI